ncbi:hypothetical protein SAMN02949497_3551 [Methylomagnum ishizawai]|uniref:Uncharacterized protein n=1 Tax=Methylomagnum ishizawai TaxID=1760988 RepID=A0A1Y6D0Q3_9GAMM|nr:hypothetical protein [Methylomagnum ishizawai]SMF96166.1 hypothetical protein SAMN02949497_3551 [Methylomagnum ishizawai]
MANHAQIAPFSWGDVSLSQAVHVNGIPHATKIAIGEWLEYSFPRESINKILERNPYLEAFSVEVNLTSTDGKNYDTTVYHPMGFLLIVMESGQPKAQAAKVAIAAFVWHFCGGQDIAAKDAIQLRQVLLKTLAALQSCHCAFSQRILLDQVRDVCRQLRQPIPDLSLIGKDPKQTALEGF